MQDDDETNENRMSDASQSDDDHNGDSEEDALIVLGDDNVTPIDPMICNDGGLNGIEDETDDKQEERPVYSLRSRTVPRLIFILSDVLLSRN